MDYGHFISSVAFCILAYSGVESVIQTAGLVRSWKEIRRAYLFLALTVGIVTPLVTILVLSSPIDFKAHEGDLVTYYATMLNGLPFGVTVAALASFTLMMAVNTAFVASSELLERVAHRYGFHWFIVTNRRHSLYRIHIASATFFSIIIMLTMGSQEELANMYALGLVASFCINMGSLILYRYFKGTAEGMTYLHQPVGHPHPLDHPGKLLHLPGHRQDARHHAVGRGDQRHAGPGLPGGPQTGPGVASRSRRRTRKWT